MLRKHTLLKINLNHFEWNIKLIKEKYPQKEILMMVKANAYGHGALSLVDFCMEKNLLKQFGVATLGEALEIREGLTFKNFDLFVFSESLLWQKSSLDYYIAQRIIPVIHRIEDLEYFLESRKAGKHSIPLVL
jgi:alanine racemase